MHQVDFTWEGFNWIHHDDYQQSVIAFRRIDKEGNNIIVVCNFQPMYRENYAIGVPEFGVYGEVFNSDDEQYGGTGKTNGTEIHTVAEEMHGFDQALYLNLPPMSALYLKLMKKEKSPKEIAAEEKAAKRKEAAKKAAATRAAKKAAKAADAKKVDKPAAKKAAAKKAPAKKTEAKKPAAKKAPAKKAPAKKKEDK